MSTLVVVKKGDEVAIAADSLSSYGSTRLAAEFDANPEKIFSANGSFVGAVGSAAHGLVLESVLTREDLGLSFQNRQEIFRSFLKLHPVLKKEFFLLTEEDEDKAPYESSQFDLLIANASGIYGVHSLREVYEYSRFWATGSGWKYALGAMTTVYEGTASAEEIARIGVEAGSQFDQGSGLPCQSVSLKLATS